MHLKLPVVLLSAFALAAPGAVVHGKAKDKDKNKDKKEQKSDDRRGDRHDDDRDHRDGDRDGKVTICHIPPGNRSARHTITVSESAWQAHQGHGDHRGACDRSSPRPSPRPRRSFDDLDVDDDGAISLEEWPGDRASFDRLDRDGNHRLSRREFARR